MGDVIALILFVLFLTTIVGWFFYSDKIVRMLGLVDDEDASWLFPTKND